MKKVLLLVVIAFGIIFSANAQFRVGGGIAAGSNISMDDDGDGKFGFGIQVRGEYDFTDKISAAAGFNYYFPDVPEGFDFKLNEIFAQGHYYFLDNGDMKIYGLAGLSYIMWDVSYEIMGYSSSADGTETGLILGGGINYSLGNMSAFGELKYNTIEIEGGDAMGIMINAGILIPIGG